MPKACGAGIRNAQIVSISYIPMENRKASMDCLEGQSKVAKQSARKLLKLKLEQEIIKDVSLPLRKASKVVCTICSMSHD